MWPIANMVWRIGEVLDFEAQIAWMFAAGFDAVSLHASGGVPGKWQGIEPAACSAPERQRLRRLIEPFTFVEVHAPFRIELCSEDLAGGLAELTPVLGLAGDLGADLVTVHAQVPETGQGDLWSGPMAELSAAAERSGVTIGLEILSGFDTVRSWRLPNIGVTLDVGHARLLPEGQRWLAATAGLGGAIRELGALLRHLHVHDVCGSLDHCEIGTGSTDFAEITAALADIRYRGMLCLELNPDRVSPEGILRSRTHLAASFPNQVPD